MCAVACAGTGGGLGTTPLPSTAWGMGFVNNRRAMPRAPTCMDLSGNYCQESEYA